MKKITPIKAVWILLLIQLTFFLLGIFIDSIGLAGAAVSWLAFSIGALLGLPALIYGIVKKDGEFMACGYLLSFFNTAPAAYGIYLCIAW